MGRTGANCGKLEQTGDSFRLLSGSKRYSMISSPWPATTGRGFLFCNLCATFAITRPVNRGRSTVHVWPMSAPINARAASACASASAARSTSPGVPRQRRTDRSLRNRETSYIRLLRACLSQFLLKEPIPPKNLLYVSPFSLASYLTKASSIVQR